jgi:integrase
MSTKTIAAAAEGIKSRIAALKERPKDVTLREVIQKFMMAYTGRDPNLGGRLIQWEKLLGDFTLEQITSDVVHAAREELQELPTRHFRGLDADGNKVIVAQPKRKSAATVNRCMFALGSVLSWADEQRLTPTGWAHPLRSLKRLTEPKGRVRFLKDDERIRLIAECRASKYPRLAQLVLFALQTGARKSEILSLKWKHVDLDAGTATLERTKNGQRRILVLLPQLIAELKPLQGDRERFVFGSAADKFQRPANIDGAWNAAVARAGISDFRFHDCRHCCGSALAQAGVDIAVIADVLGHNGLEMSRRYAHLRVEDRAAALARAMGGKDETKRD